jgi:hypothetical protein
MRIKKELIHNKHRTIYDLEQQQSTLPEDAD